MWYGRRGCINRDVQDRRLLGVEEAAASLNQATCNLHGRASVVRPFCKEKQDVRITDTVFQDDLTCKLKAFLTLKREDVGGGQELSHSGGRN